MYENIGTVHPQSHGFATYKGSLPRISQNIFPGRFSKVPFCVGIFKNDEIKKNEQHSEDCSTISSRNAGWCLAVEKKQDLWKLPVGRFARLKAIAFCLASLSASGDVLRTAGLPAAFLFPLP
jgi:hypothetical protein